MTIVEFLEARMFEDEALAVDVANWAGHLAHEMDGFSVRAREFAEHMTPARALAECAAKRRIVTTHEPVDNEPDGWCTVCDGDGWPCVTMAALATVYADHSDYDESWRP